MGRCGLAIWSEEYSGLSAPAAIGGPHYLLNGGHSAINGVEYPANAVDGRGTNAGECNLWAATPVSDL